MRAAVLFAAILLAGCAKHDDNCTPASEFYTFQMFKSLDTSAGQVSIVIGNQTVFDLRYNYQQCAGVVGAAVSRDIYFQVRRKREMNSPIQARACQARRPWYTWWLLSTRI